MKTPTTPSLSQEPIRTELPVQYIQQLPNIENLLLHLEGKGRKPATLQATEKGLKALALRADLKDPRAVELARAVARLQTYITDRNLKLDDLLFAGRAKGYGED